MNSKRNNIPASSALFLKSMTPDFVRMEEYVASLQATIASHFALYEKKPLTTIPWKREDGGGGISMQVENGTLFEKAALHRSSISGMLSPASAKALLCPVAAFKACGLSLIFHPYSPHIPTVHMNVRTFVVETGNWYGGGIDLTPYYPHEEDFVFFHKELLNACNTVQPGLYEKYKEECDKYFYLPHRKEMRGIGGVFFDRLTMKNGDDFNLTVALGNVFCNSYFPLVEKRIDCEHTEEEKTFQAFRHGRYVEFNLLHDRGTIFGLTSGGRVESILSSLPQRPQFPLEPAMHFPFIKKMMKYYQPQNWVGK